MDGFKQRKAVSMDELNKIREPRIRAWCLYYDWTQVYFDENQRKWIGNPPYKTGFTPIPNIAWKPPFPGDIPPGS